MGAPWTVLKFGGNSVATHENWRTIARETAERARHGRVLVVCSALAGVTDHLLTAVAEARSGSAGDGLAGIRRVHAELASAAGLDAAAPALASVWSHLEEAARLLEGVRLTLEAPPRLTARILAVGELASTRLGEAILATLGVTARWLDVR